MRTMKIPLFASADDIIKKAEKHSKHKKFTFAQWPDNTVRLIITNGTVGRYEGDENED